jgi:hypothetical protein
VTDALEGIFPSRKEMEDDLSIDGMVLVFAIMEKVTKKE